MHTGFTPNIAKGKMFGRLNRVCIEIVSGCKNPIAQVLGETVYTTTVPMWQEETSRCSLDVVWQHWQKHYPDLEKCDIFRMGKLHHKHNPDLEKCDIFDMGKLHQNNLKSVY